MILFVGDVHGAWGNLQDAINAHPEVDAVVQVGDFGVFPNIGIQPPAVFNKPVFFIDGNHENHEYLSALTDNEIAKGVTYLPRATQHIIDGRTINVMGGAQSIDQHHRIEGRDWFRGEIPSFEQMSQFLELPAADIIVTHTAPLAVVRAMGYIDCNDPVSRDLEFVRTHIEYTPKVWFFGHWHRPFDKVIDGVRFVCLPCVHDTDIWVGKWVGVPASKGMVI